MVSVGNTNMAFNVETGSTIHGANESSQMSDVTGSAGDDPNQNANQFSNPQQMMMGNDDGNSDFTKKVYKAKRFKPQN